MKFKVGDLVIVVAHPTKRWPDESDCIGIIGTIESVDYDPVWKVFRHLLNARSRSGLVLNPIAECLRLIKDGDLTLTEKDKNEHEVTL